MQKADRMQHVNSAIRGPLYEEALRMQESGIKVLKLNTGNPGSFGFAMPDSVRQALLNSIDDAVAYCDFRGMPKARQAICDYHRRKGAADITPEDIFCGNGVSELVGMVATAAFNPGDELLVPSPSYSLWSNSALLADAAPVFYRCDEQALWYPDVADIRRNITPRTRGIVIINPNNPTGAVYNKEVLLQIVALARQHRLVLFADEIYDRLVMDGETHHAVAALAPDLPVFTFNGLSKSHIICGFRCGWLVLSGPPAQLREIKAALGQLASMRLCANALTQLAIPAALADEASTRTMLGPGGRLYEQRQATLEVIRQADGVSAVPNKASFYLFPKFDAKRFRVTDDNEFALGLLKQKHILVVPGSGFDYPQPDHFRIVMLPDAPTLRRATQDMVDYLHSRA